MPFFGGGREIRQMFNHTLAEVEGFVGRVTVPPGHTVLKDIELLGSAFVDQRLADFSVQVEDNRHREDILRTLAMASPYFRTLFDDWKNFKDSLNGVESVGLPISPAEAMVLLSWLEMLRDTALTRGPRI